MPDLLTPSFLVVVLVLFTAAFMRICLRLRRGGGSLATAVLGATDGFLAKKKSKAAEAIVNENAGRNDDGAGGPA